MQRDSTRTPVARVVVACVVLAVAATAFVVGFSVSHHGSPAAAPTSSTPPAAPTRPRCVRPVTAPPPSQAPHRIGNLPYRSIASGVFEQPVAGPDGSVLALEACGAEESSLRVVDLDTKTGSEVASRSFLHAAPLASALAATSSGVWLGEGRLALGGSPTDPPYQLTLVRLDPATLTVTATTDLGRGYGVGLVIAANGSLVVSTGRQLFEVDPSGHLRSVASFPDVIAQHVAAVPAHDRVLVSLFTPSAAPPQPGTRLVLVSLRSGHVLAQRSLPAGSEVESLAVSGTTASVAVNTAGASAVREYAVRGAITRDARLLHGPLPATLTQLSLRDSGVVVWAYGQSTLACTTGANGSVRASFTPRGTSEALSGLLPLGGGEVAVVTPGGIGTIHAPPACRTQGAPAIG